jgi:hypothetical protein
MRPAEPIAANRMCSRLRLELAEPVTRSAELRCIPVGSRATRKELLKSGFTLASRSMSVIAIFNSAGQEVERQSNLGKVSFLMG